MLKIKLTICVVYSIICYSNICSQEINLRNNRIFIGIGTPLVLLGSNFKMEYTPNLNLHIGYGRIYSDYFMGRLDLEYNSFKREKISDNLSNETLIKGSLNDFSLFLNINYGNCRTCQKIQPYISAGVGLTYSQDQFLTNLRDQNIKKFNFGVKSLIGIYYRMLKLNMGIYVEGEAFSIFTEKRTFLIGRFGLLFCF